MKASLAGHGNLDSTKLKNLIESDLLTQARALYPIGMSFRSTKGETRLIAGEYVSIPVNYIFSVTQYSIWLWELFVEFQVTDPEGTILWKVSPQFIRQSWCVDIWLTMYEASNTQDSMIDRVTRLIIDN